MRSLTLAVTWGLTAGTPWAERGMLLPLLLLSPSSHPLCMHITATIRNTDASLLVKAENAFLTIEGKHKRVNLSDSSFLSLVLANRSGFLLNICFLT